MKADWITIVEFSGPGTAKLYSSAGGDPVLGDETILNGEKIGSIELSGTTGSSQLIIRTGAFNQNQSLSNVPDPDSPVDGVVHLNVDTQGNYLWGGASAEPWMNTYTEGSTTTDVAAPDGSGGVVITGNIIFDSSCTGFGSLMVDGSLKGTISGLDEDETIDEIQLGYINGPEGATTGGLNLDGNVDRLRVRTNVAGIGDRSGQSDRWGPASIVIGGHLIEFQTSGTVFADIIIGGDTDAGDMTFDQDSDVGYGERYSVNAAAGYINDTMDAAQVVGSPTGDFAIEGFLSWVPFTGANKTDTQDWYVFCPGLGQEVSMQMGALDSIEGWVFSPSGRLVGNVDSDGMTFVADEPGAYYLMVGNLGDAGRYATSIEDSYTVDVSGTQPMAVAGIVGGSNAFGAAVAGGEFGDDVWDTELSVGYDTLGLQTAVADLGLLDARGGTIADVTVTVSGDACYIAAADSLTGDGDEASYTIMDDFGKLETTTGSLGFNSIWVGDDFAELVSAADLGDATWSPFGGITVNGAMGAIIADGGFYAELEVYENGVELFYVGGDFGTLLGDSRVDTAQGTDVRFAYVGGIVYDQGNQVPSLSVTNESLTFVDDGGAVLHLTPTSTQTETTPGGEGEPDIVQSVPATLTARYLPIGQPGGFGAGAVLLDVVCNDTLTITVEEGRADIGYVTFGEAETSSLRIASSDPLAELDIFHVTATGATVGRITNNTFRGDIVDVEAGATGDIFAKGHVGITERWVSGAGSLPNPDSFVPPTVSSVSVYDAAGVTDSHRYFHGVVASGAVPEVRANGSIGDVYAQSLGTVRADANNRTDGAGFIFRGMERATRAWDGIAGVIYSETDIDLVAIGDGIYGGPGGRPVGGIFAGGIVEDVTGSNALIEGPIFGAGGIGTIYGRNGTSIENTVLGAGADFSDWAMWDVSRLTTQTIRLENIRLLGNNAGLDSIYIQTGVLGTLYIGPGSDGWTDVWLHAMGDPTTEESINAIYIYGGGMDGTNVIGRDIDAIERIGRIIVRGNDGDITNMTIRTLKTIAGIDASGDIVFEDLLLEDEYEFYAPLGIGYIKADNIGGTGTLYVGTSDLARLLVMNNFSANLTVDGPVHLADIRGSLLGNFVTLGPSGYVERLLVRDGITGNLSIGNYIEQMIVWGDVDGTIGVGGSNRQDEAIGLLKVINGDLLNDILIDVNTGVLRPGGGIGTIIVVNGSIVGDLTATSYYDTGKANAVRADIDVIKIINGDLDGALTIQQNNPADPNDPGGNVGILYVINGDINDDVTIAGSATKILVKNGHIDGDVTVTRDLDYLLAYSDNAVPAVSGDVTVGRDLRVMKVLYDDVTGAVDVGRDAYLIYVRGGNLGGGLTVGDTLSKLIVINGKITGGAVDIGDDLDLIKIINRGGMAVDVGMQVGDWTDKAILYGDVAGPLTFGTDQANDGLGLLKLLGDLDEEFTVLGNLEKFILINGQVSSNGAPLDPRIEVTGNADLMKIIGVADGTPVIDDEVEVGDELDFFYVRNGTMTGTLEAGRMGRILYYTSNGIQAALTSNSNLDLLKVLGPVNAPVTVAHFADKIIGLDGSTAAGDFVIGDGTAGAGVDFFYLRGNMLGDLDVDGNADMAKITGDFTDAMIDVSGTLDLTYILGDYTDSDIDANRLGRVLVKGTTSGTGEITADGGMFEWLANGDWYDITDGVGETIDNIHAYID